MKDDKVQQDLGVVKRRDFLKSAGLAIGAAGAAAVMAKPTEAQAHHLNTTGRGYQETEHVRTYYELAKF